MLSKAADTSDILAWLYSIANEPTSETVQKAESFKFDFLLEEWTKTLPYSLQLDTQEQINESPAHVLNLHMQKECVTISIQFPS